MPGDNSEIKMESVKGNALMLHQTPPDSENVKGGDTGEFLVDFNILEFVQRALPGPGRHSDNVQGMGLVEYPG